ncbi:MAG: FAD-binding oxidoreductase [Thermomicrobiales bacterium]|nr:FAD-binding oxidoreductase [Thermomicrobiales bacterium]
MNARDVVVIGGGISGTAATYELARAGASVTLVEQGTLANMASGWTLAGVRQSGRDPAELPLAMAAVARWGGLDDELGADLEYRREGNLRLAMTEEQVEPTREMVAEQRGLGLDLDFLPDNRAVRGVAPAIAETVLAASYCPTDGHANPNRTVEAFARAAERHGARLLTGTAVTGIAAEGGRVRGVRTSGGDIPADAAVVAAGVFSGHLLAPLGIDLPIDVARVAVVQTTPMPPLLRQVLGTGAADFAGRQEVSGRFRFTDGGTPWPHGLDALADGFETALPSVQAVARALASATAALPALAGARIARVWGGLLDMTPDALPVIERVPEVEGLVVAAGFSGHGFCLGPVTGQILRDLVVEGETSFPIAPFRRPRFAWRQGHAAATLHG